MNATVTHAGRFLSAAALTLLSVSAAADRGGNRSITIDEGAQSGGQSTINGSISVGRGAIVDGSLETVNGTIRIDDNARLGNAETVNGDVRLAGGVSAAGVSSVNGSIRIDGNVTVSGAVSVVNGRIGIAAGSRVAGDVGGVNGGIEIRGAELDGNLSTVAGDVELTDGAILHGDLIVEEPSGWSSFGWRKPKIVIGPGVRVDGELRLEREVELYLSDSASVGGVRGKMSLDDAVRFSGARP